MSHDVFDETAIDESGNAPSSESGRLFVDLGAGAGAVPVRAEVGRAKFLKSSHTAVIGFMLVLAAGGIYGMRTLGLGVRHAAAEVPIDLERESQPAIAAGKFDALMAELERGDRPVQIPTSKLNRKSPFELEVDVTEVATDVNSESDEARALRLAAEAAERAAEARRMLIDEKLGTMKLFAVVGGRNPAARINMSVVRKGDIVADLFQVVEIQPRAVILECDGERYTLVLAGKSNGS